MHPYLGEFFGTLILVLLGNGVVANVLLPKTKGHAGGWIVITLGWGMAVFIAVWCVQAISGAHLNPAVTLGIASAGVEGFSWSLAPGYIAAQMAGGIAGASLVYLTYKDHYDACQDPDAIRGTFCNTPAVRNLPLNTFGEAIGTFVLVIAVLAAVGATFEVQIPKLGAVAEGKVGLGTIGALPVGLLVLSIGLSLGGPTGYAINPARDLGPRIAHALLPIRAKGGNDWGYSWVPVLGPCLGGLVAAAMFRTFW